MTHRYPKMEIRIKDECGEYHHIGKMPTYIGHIILPKMLEDSRLWWIEIKGKKIFNETTNQLIQDWIRIVEKTFCVNVFKTENGQDINC
jgi:hypothetical protein